MPAGDVSHTCNTVCDTLPPGSERESHCCTLSRWVGRRRAEGLLARAHMSAAGAGSRNHSCSCMYTALAT
jgi:hypothetical protein